VKAALKADKEDFYRHVTAVARNGVVTLGGFVSSDTAQARAKDQMHIGPQGESTDTEP